MHHGHVIRVPIYILVSGTQARSMATSPLASPSGAVVFRVWIVEIGRKGFGRVFEHWKERSPGVSESVSVRESAIALGD